jgi:hypothetical protein
MADVIHKVLSEAVEYREGRRVRRASKRELIIRKLFLEAMRGDLRSSEPLLKLRMHAENNRDPVPWLSGSSMIPMKTPRDQWIKGDRRPR